MSASFEQKTIDLLKQPNFATLSTLREDGSVHAVVIWYGLEGEQLAFNSAEGRDWPANVRRDPRVTVTIPNSANPYEFVSIRGRVVREEHEGADAHIDALAKHYMDADSYPFRKEGEVRVRFVVEPETVSHFGV